ncbi:leader peptidase (prepilin peptidase)/N-methyltransferase [Shimia isoporae]|uniref:Prepilin leader peptidase/N-methyltransferase n=1 Tax=Shimia isoporae TaxID=647720 RepID=A0A4R1N9Q9_9RHOB|nr:A24 family peptidase [Shimia isoporae]TCK99864.1 leader peptidase (prepilin peptidase)/N-methyltransferase [Shimia isoporae]
MFQTDAIVGPDGGVIIFLILLSPAVGSFLAVLIDRLPRGEDALIARSRCRSCRNALTWRDLIPLVSFFASRGVCRHCGAPVPQWLLAMEVSALVIALVLILLWPESWPIHAMAVDLAFLWLLLALFAADLKWMRLPDLLTGALFGLVLLRSLVLPGMATGAALAGAVLGSMSFLILRWAYLRFRRREGLGLGDVKLMAGLGAFAGPLDLPLLILVAALLTLASALVLRVSGKQVNVATPFPFGAALCLSGALLWVAYATAVIVPA